MVRIVRRLSDPRDTALVEAVAAGDLEAAAAALRAGANVKGRSEAAVHALHWAVLHDDGPGLLDLLAHADADPRATWQQRTFIMVAAEHGALPVVRRLVELGVDPHAADDQRGTALDIAIARGSKDIAHYLASLGVPERHAGLRGFVAALRKSWGGRAAWCSGPVALVNPKPGAWTVQAQARLDGYRLVFWKVRLSERLLRRFEDTWITINSDDLPDQVRRGPRVEPLSSPFTALAVPVFRRTDGAPCDDDRLRAVCRSIEADVAALRLDKGEHLQIAGDALVLHARGLDAAQAIARRTILESMASTLADARPPRPPLRREPLAVKVGRGASTTGMHRWGGQDSLATRCPACGAPATPILRLDLADPLLAGLGVKRRDYPVHWCTDCCDWGPLFFDLATDEPTAIGPAEAWEAGDEDLSTPVPAREVTLAPAAARGKGGSRLGGEPGWLQEESTPDCPRCGDPMAFVLQLAGTRDIDFCDEGRLYSFACPACLVSATLIQSH